MSGIASCASQRPQRAPLGLSYDGGGFFRYEGGTKWTRLGPVTDTTQIYGTAIYEGSLFAGTWPTGSVFRYAGPQKWVHAGRLGMEKEVMGMAVYNGKLYAGTLPFADVYRYDGGSKWTTTGRLDNTPDVGYRRAWSMAVFEGKLFCGVFPLPDTCFRLKAGKSVTYDRALSSGWHHLAEISGRATGCGCPSMGNGWPKVLVLTRRPSTCRRRGH
ncbi:MAG: hypothetical protein Ct9H300mP1_34180 [Planctomycetaceae bacterium]|nr:MAG: hypothetical protein Ct9H300mP1_34180 [Planctomycetaceae bacterium]